MANNELGRYMQNERRVVKSYKYTHIWWAEEEVRLFSTDPAIIMKFVDAIELTYDCKFEYAEDLADQRYKVTITKMEPEDRHQKIAWWMFKMLCERGWEPMDVRGNEYRLKFCEVVEKGFQ